MSWTCLPGLACRNSSKRLIMSSKTAGSMVVPSPCPCCAIQNQNRMIANSQIQSKDTKMREPFFLLLLRLAFKLKLLSTVSLCYIRGSRHFFFFESALCLPVRCFGRKDPITLKKAENVSVSYFIKKLNKSS